MNIGNGVVVKHSLWAALAFLACSYSAAFAEPENADALPWKAQVTKEPNGKPKTIGSYATKEECEAAMVRWMFKEGKARGKAVIGGKCVSAESEQQG